MTITLYASIAFSLALYALAYFFLGWWGVLAPPIIVAGLAITSGAFD